MKIRIEIQMTDLESSAITKIAEDKGHTRKSYIEFLVKKEIERAEAKTALTYLKELVSRWDPADPTIDEVKKFLKQKNTKP